MCKKYYYAKDVTCPICEGLGYLYDAEGTLPLFDIETIENNIRTIKSGEKIVTDGEDLEYWEQQREWYYEYYHCFRCDGKGYVHDEVDPITGFTIIEMNGECK